MGIEHLPIEEILTEIKDQLPEVVYLAAVRGDLAQLEKYCEQDDDFNLIFSGLAHYLGESQETAMLAIAQRGGGLRTVTSPDGTPGLTLDIDLR